jgi:hypothetical protein
MLERDFFVILSALHAQDVAFILVWQRYGNGAPSQKRMLTPRIALLLMCQLKGQPKRSAAAC